MQPEILLSVRNLVTSFVTDRGKIRPVNGISFDIPKGKTIGIVGESGCGKSVTAFSIMRLLPRANSRIERGEIIFRDKNLLKLSRERMRKLRGRDISMIFQEPMTALNPVYTIGDQLSEVFLIHKKISRAEAKRLSIEMLKKVRIPSPDKRYDEYPHQLSGGMKQRVIIAIALANDPYLLIADEPTTALDVTIQAQILRLMKDLQSEFHTSIMLITHNLGVVAEIADDVIVMYAGKIVEKGTVFEIFDSPAHPYTDLLLKSIPSLTDDKNSKLATIRGMVPSLFELPKGCNFQARCPYKQAIYEDNDPPLETYANGEHKAACFFALSPQKKGRK